MPITRAAAELLGYLLAMYLACRADAPSNIPPLFVFLSSFLCSVSFFGVTTLALYIAWSVYLER